MSNERRNSSGRAVLAAALFAATLASALAAEAAPPLLELTGFDSAAVDRARNGALRRLEDGTCQKIFTDFRDAQDRTLQQNLDEWSVSPADYLRLVPFIDGTGKKLCRKSNTALVSTPGVRRVFVCKAFANVQLRQPAIAESMVIHEILHTLGLGEAPHQRGAPTSIEITQHVEARCR
jgi:hypothetical protein